MLSVKFFFNEQTPIKYSRTLLTINSFSETINYESINNLCIKYKIIEILLFDRFWTVKKKRELGNCLIKDLIHLILIWRQIRGYPAYGNTTHTNAKTSRKNKLLLNFRISQFQKLFGQKKRNIFPTLIKAEYNNRLWYYNWNHEWTEANKFSEQMASLKGKGGFFNPVLLAEGQTNGYIRTGKAAKIGKAKKLVKLFTLGVPLFFTRFIYYPQIPQGFSSRLILKDEVNKKLGKKLRRNKK